MDTDIIYVIYIYLHILHFCMGVTGVQFCTKNTFIMGFQKWKEWHTGLEGWSMFSSHAAIII